MCRIGGSRGDDDAIIPCIIDAACPSIDEVVAKHDYLGYSFKLDFSLNLTTIIPFPLKLDIPQAFGVSVACCEFSVIADAAIESFSFDKDVVDYSLILHVNLTDVKLLQHAINNIGDTDFRFFGSERIGCFSSLFHEIGYILDTSAFSSTNSTGVGASGEEGEEAAAVVDWYLPLLNIPSSKPPPFTA